MLQNEIPEQLQIIRRDVSLLTGEIQGFVQPAIMLRQKRLPFSVCRRWKNMETSYPLLRVVWGLRLEQLLLIVDELVKQKFGNIHDSNKQVIIIP
jgi:hypothetical protein